MKPPTISESPKNAKSPRISGRVQEKRDRCFTQFILLGDGLSERLLVIGTITFETAFTINEYPSFCPFSYSIEVANPILDFGQESHFDIKGSGIGIGFEGYKWIHTICGWPLYCAFAD